MKSFVIFLYVKMWKVESRCYPYLQKILLDSTAEEENKAWEVELAKAAAVKEICSFKPEVYGTEQVPLLSKILNQSRDLSGSGTSYLALQGIVALCKAGIIDISSTWKALASKLTRDKRPLVIQGLCEFFGAIPELNSSTPESEKLIDEAATLLWSYVYNCENVNVINAALRALKYYTPSQFNIKSIPPYCYKDVKVPSSLVKTPLDAAKSPEEILNYIPGECWGKLLLNIKQEALETCGELLGHWLALEISEYRSSVYNTPSHKQEPTSFDYLNQKSVCNGIVSFLLKKEDKSSDVVAECFKVLNYKGLSKPLPPFNWMCLFQKYEESHHKYCLALASQQAMISPSARNYIEKYLKELKPNPDNLDEVAMVFSNIVHLCRGVPPVSLNPFFEKCLNFAIENGAYGEDINAEKLLKEILNSFKIALQTKNIHESNRSTIAIVLENCLERLEPDTKIFAKYVECATELSSKSLERMTSPSLWWEEEIGKLKKSLSIRSAVACRVETETPLVWLNECLDAVSKTLDCDKTYILKIVAKTLTVNRTHKTNCQWALQLMGRIESLANQDSANDNSKVILFLCDVFSLAIIIFAEHDCFVASEKDLFSSRDCRLRLFPQSVYHLLMSDDWIEIIPQVMEWLYHLYNSTKVSNQFASTFLYTLATLRGHKHFIETSTWMKILGMSEHVESKY